MVIGIRMVSGSLRLGLFENLSPMSQKSVHMLDATHVKCMNLYELIVQ